MQQNVEKIFTTHNGGLKRFHVVEFFKMNSIEFDQFAFNFKSVRIRTNNMLDRSQLCLP